MDSIGGSNLSGCSSSNQQSEQPPAGCSITTTSDSSPRYPSSLAPAMSYAVRKVPGLEQEHGMCVDMGGMDLRPFEPSSSFGREGGGILGVVIDNLAQEPSEELFRWDDLDSLLYQCSGVTVDLQSKQLQFAGGTPDSGTLESNSQARSSFAYGVGEQEIRGDHVAMGGSVGANSPRMGPSPGKRKREEVTESEPAPGDRREDDGVALSIQQEHPIDSTPAQAQKQTSRGSKRPDKSMRKVIETRSDIDILDDGYKWRKYGQKPAKNSAHPRNYYRCATPSCPVRKQVERCTENPLNVLTTYDGMHNHPGKQGHNALESLLPLMNARGNPDSAPLASTSTAPGTAPVIHQDGSPGQASKLPTLPTNYVPPDLVGHMLENALFEPKR